MTKTSPQLRGLGRPNSAGDVVEPVRYRLPSAPTCSLHRLVAGATDVAAICQDRVHDERVRGIARRRRGNRACASPTARSSREPPCAPVDLLIHDRRPLHEGAGCQRDLGFTVAVDRRRALRRRSADGRRRAAHPASRGRRIRASGRCRTSGCRSRRRRPSRMLPNSPALRTHFDRSRPMR